jgi:hypothetical protein
LPEALAWAARQERESLGERRGDADAFTFRQLIDEVTLRGWQHLDTEGIAGALAELVLARLRRQPGFYATTVGPDDRADFASDDTKRRRLLAEVLDRLDDADSVFLLAGPRTGLVSRDDFGWLVERHDTTQNPTVGRALAGLAGRMFDPERADHRDIVFALDRTGELYTEQFASWLEPRSGCTRRWPTGSATFTGRRRARRKVRPTRSCTGASSACWTRPRPATPRRGGGAP